jgi:hypothetical protein
MNKVLIFIEIIESGLFSHQLKGQILMTAGEDPTVGVAVGAAADVEPVHRNLPKS